VVTDGDEGAIADQVSPRAWSELLHAEVAYVLRMAGVPTLHIKGPTVVRWLYDEGERPWGDVDVLVAPSRMDAALTALAAAGFVERFPGVNRRTSDDHAITMAQVDPALPETVVAEVDVHDRFEGIETDAERAFAELWRRREPDSLGHVDVWFPDLPTRALLLVLNTARSETAQSLEDLRRLLVTGDRDEWDQVVALATRVQALPALRAGLEILPEGRDVVATTALRQVPVSPQWLLRRAGAPRTALRVEELGRLPWRRRPATVVRWLVPPPALVRMRDPAADGGPVRLAGGYARRWRDGARSLVPSLRAVARARRSEVRHDGRMSP
jgi:hypothetical protein